ncbi:hypothetical protein H696_03150 [Fonticula alba]|uniref:protein-tyrosine-phosphatase n=1 Tax=Fonticula alba TaxID=691883 RepID=A0A058Z905_FONAL|nr:hypothetical protein H696_03150 [Fonticula alba]KCV70799.1 hypothetical protein H696_03150 [Fonticula alba]|eukprot:XP_009495315.1 hypothetical protein H696_03150 [Fonticula alba]
MTPTSRHDLSIIASALLNEVVLLPHPQGGPQVGLWFAPYHLLDDCHKLSLPYDSTFLPGPDVPPAAAQRRPSSPRDHASSSTNASALLVSMGHVVTPYTSFLLDFGPLNIAQSVRLGHFIKQHISTLSQAPDLIVLICDQESQEDCSNAVVLLGAYVTLFHDAQWTAIDRYVNECMRSQPNGQLKLFRDPSYWTPPATFANLSPRDCLAGLIHARDLGWFDLSTFSVQEYLFRDHPNQGDWNWVVPPPEARRKTLATRQRLIQQGKLSPVKSTAAQVEDRCCGLLAFAGPDLAVPHQHPSIYVDPFKSQGISTVVRLNNANYDRAYFQHQGFDHFDMIYPDGHNPPDVVLQQFLALVLREYSRNGSIALHCMAGLGRTGTLICASMLAFAGFPGPMSAIGYLRLMRPGSVVGPQQVYLLEYLPQFHRIARELLMAAPPPSPIRLHSSVLGEKVMATLPTTNPFPLTMSETVAGAYETDQEPVLQPRKEATSMGTYTARVVSPGTRLPPRTGSGTP